MQAPLRVALFAVFAGFLWLGARARAGAPDVSAKGPLAQHSASYRAEPGVFPDSWINGVKCGTEVPLQVHAYNDDFYIIRESKCTSFEAPFMFLIFGEERVLLLDTGSPAPGFQLRPTIDAIIEDWLARKNRGSIELIVAHTHSHFDHIAADGQFENRPNTTVVGLAPVDVAAFFGFDFGAWPEGQVTFDLGGRVLDIFQTPGHQIASLTVYDRRTQLLLTGDIVYPGHLFVFSAADWFDFKDSIDRLVQFAATHPVSWILGCHIEMSNQPGVPFPYGTPAQPDEHVLQFPPSILLDIQAAHQMQGDDPECTTYAEFVIQAVYKCGL